MNTPKTPRLSSKRQQALMLAETPDCFEKVTVETPRSNKKATNKNANKEVKNLTVAVRIRPLNVREESTFGVTNVIRVDNKAVLIDSSLVSNTITKVDYMFQYDHVFWSCDESDSLYSNQKDVFKAVGSPLLEQAFDGYNACLFAYGQTGSGKSYSMMGPDIENIDCDANAGIIPLFCQKLFNKISELDDLLTVDVNISYFEIYNEKIHDLLSSGNNDRTPLKVREHPDWGPYVVNLSTHSVKTFEEMRSWLVLGNQNRAYAATMMNEKSSRSHSIFAIELSISNGANASETGRRSKVSMVDLAGSERIGGMSHGEEKHKESVSINKSLLTLGKVICSLADQRKGTFVPYRDSVLTWLLKESLGGNSFSSMLATITPASSHIDETLATLRYACKARSIINQVRINEDSSDKIIRELTTEVNRLKRIQRESICKNVSTPNRDSPYKHELEELRQKIIEKEVELTYEQQMWENRFRENRQQQLMQLVQYEKTQKELESQVRVMSSINDNEPLSPYNTNFLEEMKNILDGGQNQEDQLNGGDCKEIQYSIATIYKAAQVLKPYTEKEEKMRLTFAKLMKSVQILESSLCNKNSPGKKSVKFRI